LPANADLLLFDTSAALAFVDAENPFHQSSWDLASTRPRGLAGHAVFEFLSVLTRLPLPKRLQGPDALRLMRSEFPENRFLPAESMNPLVDEFAQAGVVGGMVYDGLVGACARHHGLMLVTCDRRAKETYRLLGVSYRLLEEAQAPVSPGIGAPGYEHDR
jgi:predicted nucleic acid-binding protein